MYYLATDRDKVINTFIFKKKKKKESPQNLHKEAMTADTSAGSYDANPEQTAADRAGRHIIFYIPYTERYFIASCTLIIV